MNRSVSREHWHQHVAASVHERNRTERTAAARDMIPSKRHTLAMHAPGQVKQEFFKYPTPEYNFNYVDQLISGDMTELQSSTASTKYRRLLFNIVPPKVCYVRAHRRVRRIALLFFSLFLPGVKRTVTLKKIPGNLSGASFLASRPFFVILSLFSSVQYLDLR